MCLIEVRHDRLYLFDNTLDKYLLVCWSRYLRNLFHNLNRASKDIVTDALPKCFVEMLEGVLAQLIFFWDSVTGYRGVLKLADVEMNSIGRLLEAIFQNLINCFTQVLVFKY